MFRLRARIGGTALLILILCWVKGTSAGAEWGWPGILPLPPVRVALPKTAPAPIPEPPWMENVRAMKLEAGLAPVPREHPVIRLLLQQGELPGALLQNPDVEWYVIKARISPGNGQSETVHAVMAMDWRAKAIIWAVGVIGSAVGTCLFPYIVNPDLHWDSSDDLLKRPSCASIIRTVFGDDRLAASVDEYFGDRADEVLILGHRASALVFDRTVLVMTKDSLTSWTYSRQGKQTFQLPVAPQIIGNRMFVPIRALENTGLVVDYDPQTRSISLAGVHKAVTLHIGDKQALVSDGRILHADVAPFLLQDRTMVPVRFALTEFCSLDYLTRSKRVLATCER